MNTIKTTAFMDLISEASIDCERAQEAADRFLQAAALLPAGNSLGCQITFPKSGDCKIFIFSDADLSHPDLTWIFRCCAPMKTCPAETALLNEKNGRYHFILTENKPDSLANREDPYGHPERFIYEMKDRFLCLIPLLTDADAVIKFLLSPDHEDHVHASVVMSLEETASLRLQTSLALTFPGMRLTPYGRNTQKQKLTTNAAFISMEPDMTLSENNASGISPSDESILMNAVLRATLERAALRCQEKEHPELADTGILQMDIDELALSVRAYNVLKRAGVNTVMELMNLSADDLMSIRNMNKACIQDIRTKLAIVLDSASREVKQSKIMRPSWMESGNVCSQATASSSKSSGKSNMEQLDDLIGLNPVKEQVHRIAALARMKKCFEEQKREVAPVTLNMAFLGNPGTAKTTVARILAGIFHEIGLLKTSEILEVGRADLVAGYVGQTALTVQNVFSRAKGKLLFIDEAYSLVDDHRGLFADEAISTIVQEMENHRQETIVVFAGYPKQMEEFLSLNPGLKSRVPFQLYFPDYTPEEMVQIAESTAASRGFVIDQTAIPRIRELCADASRSLENGNGRFCRNLVENAVISYAMRNFGDGISNTAAPDDRLVLLAEDFTAPLLKSQEKEAHAPIGFRISASSPSAD